MYDFPGVLENTEYYMQKFNSRKVDAIAGNFFTDDIGGGYDVIFFSYNPGGKNPLMVPKIHGALNEGGLFVNKHCFYRKGEGSKNPLLDLEWCLAAFEGTPKAARVYSFANDLILRNTLLCLMIIKIIDDHEFTCHSLLKTGDSLDAKLIIAVKR